MAHSIEDYKQLFFSLLPRGRGVWNRDSDSDLALLLEGFAVEFNRLEERVDDLLLERDTRYTDELLEEYERDFGIPESCSTLATTDTQRRVILNVKANTSAGRQDKAYFGGIANDLGLSIYIIEHTSAVCGVARCGDWVGSAEIQFYWTTGTYAHPSVYDYFQAGAGAAGDSLAELPGFYDMVCLFKIYRPAHTINLWGFWGGGFDCGFDPGFAKIPNLEGVACNTICGGFDLGFNLGFLVDRRIDIGGYFTGGFDVGFSNGFDRVQNMTDFVIYEE